MSARENFLRALSYAFGTISLLTWTIIAGYNRWRNPREARFGRDLATAQLDLWSLEREGRSSDELHHDFISISSGVKLHYISASQRPKSTRLIIFLHGFPDSCQIFAHFLSSPLADHAKVVSLDLPGFGGSDGLPNYGASEVLNAITEAIILLKERYLGPISDGAGGQRILVGHDWGAAISARLAMETEGLIDRVILLNGPVPKLLSENLRTGIATCSEHLRAWWRRKSNVRSLTNAGEAIGPVLAQLIKSNYIFMFNTPICSMRYFRFVGEYLISVCHIAAAGKEADSRAARSWASSIGPSLNECTTSDQQISYGKDVRERSISHPRGDWDTRIRLYQEDLFSGSWTMRTDQGDTSIRQVEEGQKPCFQCTSSIMWGMQDFALDYRVCVKGVERFFRQEAGKEKGESHIILLHDCGHWSPLEETGTKVLRELLLEITGITADTSSTPLKQSGIERSDFR